MPDTAVIADPPLSSFHRSFDHIESNPANNETRCEHNGGPRHACWYAFNEKLLIRLLLERSFAAEMKGIGRLQRKKDTKARAYWAPPVIIFIESGVSGARSRESRTGF